MYKDLNRKIWSLIPSNRRTNLGYKPNVQDLDFNFQFLIA